GRIQTRLHLAGGEFYFHPNMAKLRVQNLEKGQPDAFIAAAGLKPGATLLDCTLGLAADAIVASHVCGPTGNVVGLESQPLLAILAEEGLARYQAGKGSLGEAMARIRVINTDAEHYLTRLPDGAVDVVYFDPMFRHTKQVSSGMNLLRHLANPRTVTKEMLEQAVRVAAKRVVLKERQGARIFAELGIDSIVGGKYSAVSYGIITKNG
ncbi:MAG TPA: class I SAM-dependent methyltransferase, partial [Bacillota bacterium]|nr:class I SAM-dependent methyltransferase [Bacillota bacterium]